MNVDHRRLSWGALSLWVSACGGTSPPPPPSPSPASSYVVLHSFNGSDGAFPKAGLAFDAGGNLYGTTFSQPIGGGSGVLFRLTPDGTYSVLHTFSGAILPGPDGGFPTAAVVLDPAGNLYGTASSGGPGGFGVIFKWAANGTYSLLHNFSRAGGDGASPQAGLLRDVSGNLYGTTREGGSAFGFGIVFRLAPSGAYSVLHTFDNFDGAFPTADLTRDAEGNLYGTTTEGIAPGTDGVAFKLARNGTYSILHSFSGSDGSAPSGALVLDGSGNVYGTAPGGGASGSGVIFKVAPDGAYTLLHSFSGSDGRQPLAGLMRDAAGNLFGVTNGGGASGDGVIFKLAPDGTYSLLHSFDGSGGAGPVGRLVLDAAGSLYGTAGGGGASGYGVIFKFNASAAPS